MILIFSFEIIKTKTVRILDVIYVVTRNGVQQPQSDDICMRLEVISKAIKEHLSIGENWLRATQK